MPRTTRSARRVLFVAAWISPAALIAGCSNPVHSIRANPTPALDATTRPSYEIRNDDAIAIDHNLRMIHDDFRSLTLWGKPSNLTNKPMPRR